MTHGPVKVFYLTPVRDANGEIKYGPFIDGISSPCYVRSDTKAEVCGSRVPGAVYCAIEGSREESKHLYPKGPDGRCLYVTLPTGETWCIDGKSSNGPGWTRTGKPEDGTLDVNPSILTPKYHGYLRNGYLVEC